MASRVICVAGIDGALGEVVGHLVAERLEFRLIDAEVVLRAARLGRVEPREVAGAEERRSLLSRLLDSLGSSGPAEAAAVGVFVPESGAPPAPTSDALRALIQTAIEETASEGSAVIVAHGASVALAAREDVFRVLVTASPATRCSRVGTAKGISEKDAAKVIREADASRADYLKRFYGVRAELPTHYDLVVNTDRLTAEQAAELVVQAATA